MPLFCRRFVSKSTLKKIRTFYDVVIFEGENFWTQKTQGQNSDKTHCCPPMDTESTAALLLFFSKPSNIHKNSFLYCWIDLFFSFSFAALKLLKQRWMEKKTASQKKVVWLCLLIQRGVFSSSDCRSNFFPDYFLERNFILFPKITQNRHEYFQMRI